MITEYSLASGRSEVQTDVLWTCNKQPGDSYWWKLFEVQTKVEIRLLIAFTVPLFFHSRVKTTEKSLLAISRLLHRIFFASGRRDPHACLQSTTWYWASCGNSALAPPGTWHFTLLESLLSQSPLINGAAVNRVWPLEAWSLTPG